MERIKTISCFFIVITVYFGSICSLALSLYHCVFMCVRERERRYVNGENESGSGYFICKLIRKLMGQKWRPM